MRKQTFFKLFGERRPSVKLFYKLLELQPAETKEEYYRYACYLFVNHYNEMPKWYQYFLTTLMKHDWQRFYDYLTETSGFPSIRCMIKNSRTPVRICHMLLADTEHTHCTYPQIAFFAALSFDTDKTVSSLSTSIRQCRFTPETFFELAEYVKIYL